MMATSSCPKIISRLNVKDEALRAFYISLVKNQSVDDYISARRLHFSSHQIESIFLNHYLALTELILDRCSPADPTVPSLH